MPDKHASMHAIMHIQQDAGMLCSLDILLVMTTQANKDENAPWRSSSTMEIYLGPVHVQHIKLQLKLLFF